MRIAEERALELWRHGVPVICPHTNTRFFQGAAPDNVWLKGYIEILKRCDALLTVDRFAHSKGTLTEIGEAVRCHINVFYDVGRCLDFCFERGLYKPVPEEN